MDILAWLRSTWDAPLLGVVNHLLRESGWACPRLVPHAGARIEVCLETGGGAAGLTLTWAVTPAGELAAVRDAEGAPTVRLALPLAALTEQLGRSAQSSPGEGTLAGLMAQVHLSGNVELAETLAFLVRHLRWDMEADLARVVGDIPARRLALGLTALLEWQKRARQALGRNLGEALQVRRGGDSPLFPDALAVMAFAEGVDEVRDGEARLAARLQRLEQQRGAARLPG